LPKGKEGPPKEDSNNVDVGGVAVHVAAEESIVDHAKVSNYVTHNLLVLF
jgi:hypothetical protein